MKDTNYDEAGEGIMNIELGVQETVEFCLDKLHADQSKSIEDEVVDNLTFEELLGALHSAQSALEELVKSGYPLHPDVVRANNAL